VILKRSVSSATILLLISFLPTPGGPTSTMGLKAPDRGKRRATSSYVGTSSPSKSSLSDNAYISFFSRVADAGWQWAAAEADPAEDTAAAAAATAPDTHDDSGDEDEQCDSAETHRSAKQA
jgi:hypothetical protein